MHNLLFSIGVLLFCALRPVSPQVHTQNDSPVSSLESQSSPPSGNKLLADDSQSQHLQDLWPGLPSKGQSLEKSADEFLNEDLSHQNEAKFKNRTESLEAAFHTPILNKLKNDNLESMADSTSDLPRASGWTSSGFLVANFTLQNDSWPFPPKIENPLFSSVIKDSYYSTTIVRRLLQSNITPSFDQNYSLITFSTNNGSISQVFIASTGKKPKINPNTTTQANQTGTTDSTTTTDSQNTTNVTNQTENNSATNQTATNDTANSTTNSTASNQTQVNQTETSNSTSTNQTVVNETASTTNSTNSTNSDNGTQSSNTSTVTNSSQPTNSSTNNTNNTTTASTNITNNTTTASTNSTGNTTTALTNITNNTTNSSTNTSTSGSTSIIIKPSSNNYQVNGEPSTPTYTVPSSTTTSSSTPSTTQTAFTPTTTPSTTQTSTPSPSINMRDSNNNQQSTASSQITIVSDGSSPTINIEKQGQTYQFAIGKYNQNVATPGSQTSINLSLDPSSGDLTDVVSFSSPLTAFQIPADTHLMTIDFGVSSNCALPLFFASNTKYPVITSTGTAESPAFKVETDYTQSAGFFFNTSKSTSQTYSYTSSIAQARSSDFNSQTIAIIRPPKKQPAYGIVYCPYLVNPSNSFSGSIQITTQPKAIVETLWPSNSTQELASFVHTLYVPYGGNHTLEFASISSELKFSFNSSSSDLVFSTEYDAITVTTSQNEKPTKNGENVEFTAPKNSSFKIKIVNLSLENGFVLALSIGLPGGSSGATIYIVIGVVLGVVVITGLIVLVFWLHRRKRLQEIVRLNNQERLLSDPESPPDVCYPILSGLNPNSPTNLSDEDEEKKNGVGPLLRDELPDSQKVLPHMFLTDNIPSAPEHKIEIYTLNIDEFSNPDLNDHADNVILETRDKKTR